ncbi:MAG: thiamine pyrophosphate-dependent dehydrogenase E1 component subunit alpha [Deltaproteobacteria bacterium]|nr:thiamine pyrophosphate-dependent dehydrogenase E1 component subunit alpha [Deltaproteobacteria bacterium]
MEIANEKLLEMHRNLLTARRLGEKLYEIFCAGGSGMPWIHRGIGEEAIPIAVCANLRKEDYLKLTFRLDYCLFAKGLPLTEVIASECMRDCSQLGRPRSPYFDPDFGLLAHTGAGGEEIPIYLGSAISIMLKKTDQVCVCAMGDGFASRGPVHEAMVMAASWNLPIVFMIHNNQYGMGTSAKKIYKMKDIADRAKAYGFPGETVDGNDVIATYEVVKKYVDRARNGGGPSLVVGETYRLAGHYEGDPQVYRPKGEIDEWWQKDPLPRYQKRLMEMGILTEKDIAELESTIKVQIEDATKAALALPFASYENHLKTVIDEL